MAEARDTVLALAGVEAMEGDPGVLEQLEMDRGRPSPTLGNLVTILRDDLRFAGRLAFDEFRLLLTLDGQRVADTDETALNVEIGSCYGLRVSSALIGEAMRHVGRDNPKHPVRDYLQGLTWDEIPRIRTWLREHLGAPDSPFVQHAGACFLIGAVARVMQPGCKLDTMLVLHGPQGIGKSQALAALAGRGWFSDSPIDFGTKDAYQVLPGVWLYEVAELDSLRRTEASAIKAFLSAPVDHYRPAYGRNVIDQPRQSVFVGTTNEPEFLRDQTGSRRFWPVPIRFADLDGLAAARDQLWAEALHAYKAGAAWWFDGDIEQDRVAASDRFREVDAWEDPVASWADERTAPFSVADVLTGVLGKPLSQQDRRDSMRVAGILSRLGFEKRRVRAPGCRSTLWWRRMPGEEDEVG
jgi:putative DNA primase/helicase